MENLTEKHFSFRCPMNWDEMPASENGRFCGKCRKEVFDLTNCSVDEVIALQRKHGAICGSVKVAVAAASLALAACQPDKPVRTTGTPLAPGQLQKKEQPVILGGIRLPDPAGKDKDR